MIRTIEIWPILRLVALIIHVPGVMAGLSIVIAYGVGDKSAVLAFALTSILAIGLGTSLYWLLPPGHHPDFRETMVACAAGWMLSALIGVTPFMVLAYLAPGEATGSVHIFRDFWNSLFESMSGFTTTGLTVVDRPSQLPASLQWWRSLTQWVGGAGIIVLVLAVVRPGQELSKLFRAEGHERTFGHSIVDTVRETWWIYLVFTLLGMVLLRVLGMTSWESVNHAMTAVSTGGFTITDHSLRGHGSMAQSGVIFLTVLGAISFSWHQHFFNLKWLKCRSDAQVLTLLAVLITGIGLALLTQILSGESSEPFAAILHWTAAVTTSGFSTAQPEAWSGAMMLLLILAMAVGGCTGSAAGGIKLVRIVTLCREIAIFLNTIVFKPGLLVFRPATLASELETELVGRFTVAGLLVVLWFCIIAIAGFGVALLAGPDIELTDVLFDVTSALSITGLSSGFVSADLGASSKAIFIVLMWIGRLEVLPVLVFFAWLSGLRPDGGRGSSD